MLFRSVLSTALALAAVLAAIASVRADAQQVSISPTKVNFSAAQKAVAITVGNQLDRPLTLQTSVVRWEQLGGAEQQSATRDVLASPPLVEIAPGTQQVVRVALRVEPQATTESSYRLLLREVPSSDKDGNAAVGLKFLYNFSLPVFVAPVAGKLDAQLRGVATFRGTNRASKSPSVLSVVFRNSGSGHAQVTEVKLGNSTPVKHMFYVLPGGERSVELPWSEATPPPSTLSVVLATAEGAVAMDVPVRRAP